MPRLGLWVPWADSTPPAGARHTLDQRHIPYGYVRDEDIRAGKLRDKYDVLLYPHVDLELAEQIEGLHKEVEPMPFRKTSATPSFGTPRILRRHYRRYRLRRACRAAAVHRLRQAADHARQRLGLPLEAGLVRGVRREAGGTPRSTQGGGAASAAASQNAEVRTPGAPARLTARPEHPIAYGYAAHLGVPLRALHSTTWLRMAYCN